MRRIELNYIKKDRTRLSMIKLHIVHYNIKRIKIFFYIINIKIFIHIYFHLSIKTVHGIG